jgi:hypothetical protein
MEYATQIDFIISRPDGTAPKDHVKYGSQAQILQQNTNICSLLLVQGKRPATFSAVCNV